MAKISRGTFRGRLGSSAATATIGAPASYVVQKVLGAWGILDPMADTIGRWLKVSVTGEQVGWTIALIIVAIVYGIILVKIWRPRHIHHGELTAQSSVTGSIGKVVTRSQDNVASLMEAARLAYECAERSGFKAITESSQLSDDEKLHWFQTSLVGHKPAIRLFGIRPPSTVSRQIDDDQRAALHAVQGENVLVSDFAAETVRYEDVQVSREDLDTYLEWVALIGSEKI